MTASQGRADDSTSAMTAHFDSTGRALVAARRVETAILEFLGCRPADPLAAAAVVAVLGGGQLGWMLGLAGIPLGLRFRFLDPVADHAEVQHQMSHCAIAMSRGTF